jgi:hypothetical protein
MRKEEENNSIEAGSLELTLCDLRPGYKIAKADCLGSFATLAGPARLDRTKPREGQRPAIDVDRDRTPRYHQLRQYLIHDVYGHAVYG